MAEFRMISLKTLPEPYQAKADPVRPSANQSLDCKYTMPDGPNGLCEFLVLTDRKLQNPLHVRQGFVEPIYSIIYSHHGDVLIWGH